MNHELPEVLSAFVDGEAWDPVELAEALTVEGSRDALIDFVLLRARIASDVDRPDAEFYEQMRARLEAPFRPATPRWAPTVALAAVLGLAAIGLWIGFRGSSGEGTTTASDVPPVPTRTVQFLEWSRRG